MSAGNDVILLKQSVGYEFTATLAVSTAVRRQDGISTLQEQGSKAGTAGPGIGDSVEHENATVI